jgi:putative membrane protein
LIQSFALLAFIVAALHRRSATLIETHMHIKSPLAALAVAALACTGPVMAGQLNDGQILGIYIQVNGFDIETALLGSAEGASEDVRSLARHVASDHSGVRQAAYGLAEKCRVTPTLPAERIAAAIDHGKALAKLQGLKGAEFDRAYAQHEVAFHRAAIEAVKTALLPSAQCAELKAHFAQVLPAFAHHLEQTEAVAAKVGAAFTSPSR